MGLTKENPKSIQGIPAGIHLVTVAKIGWAMDTSTPEKKVLTRNEGKETGFEVIFKDNDNRQFINTYWLGGDKQKFFESMLHHIGVNPKDTISGKAMLHKRLWICVCEVVDTKGDTIETDGMGNEVKNVYIFKTYPHIEGGEKPYIEGDPALNAGIPRYQFRRYRDTASGSIKTIASPEKQETLPEKKETALEASKQEPVNKTQENPVQEEPNFGEAISAEQLPPAAENKHAESIAKGKELQEKAKTNNVQNVWDEEPNF